MGECAVYRDLQRCDHLFFPKDIFRDDLLSMRPKGIFPLQVYYPNISRRLCSVCRYRYARIVYRSDPLSPYSSNHYCLHCYTDMHTGDGGKDKYTGGDRYRYIHD
jgi:hypothetical protein